MTNNVFSELYAVIKERKGQEIEGSYTCYLFREGIDKILKKCGEECAEMIIASKNNDKEEIINEVSDLFYHILVMLADRDIDFAHIQNELSIRTQKQKNLKVFRATNKNT